MDGSSCSDFLQIKSKGELKAIIISHPHYYTTYAQWSKAFKCPIYVGADDQEWLCRRPPSTQSFHLIHGPAGAKQSICPGITAIKTGGHFPGSLVLHWENKLFIADTIVTVPVSLHKCFLAIFQINRAVCALSSSKAAWSDKFRFPMVDPKYDSSPTTRDLDNLARH